LPHAEQVAYDVLQQHAKEVPYNACGSPPLWVCRKQRGAKQCKSKSKAAITIAK
jgi:hypothetical protein